jgi:hypothetical protein
MGRLEEASLVLLFGHPGGGGRNRTAVRGFAGPLLYGLTFAFDAAEPPDHAKTTRLVPTFFRRSRERRAMMAPNGRRSGFRDGGSAPTRRGVWVGGEADAGTVADAIIHRDNGVHFRGEINDRDRVMELISTLVTRQSAVEALENGKGLPKALVTELDASVGATTVRTNIASIRAAFEAE